MRSLVLAALLALPTLALAQGALTPPASAFSNGAPAPTMRTLDQLEPRTPVPGGTTAYTIAAPGSYYLTGNIAVTSGNAITITCNDVTLELNGFTLSSTANPAAGYGVELTGNLTHVVIRNGHVSSGVYLSDDTTAGTGFDGGIRAAGMLLNDIVVEDVSVTGVASKGISLDTLTNTAMTTIVRRCAVSTSGRHGIVATQVIDCAVDNCRSTAITGTIIVNSYGSSLVGYGIGASTVENSYGRSNTGGGITAGSISNSYGYCVSDTAVAPDSGYGIVGLAVTNSYGETYSGKAAIKTNGTASFCFGRYAGHPAIVGRHAFGCTTNGTIGTTSQDHCH